MATIIDASVMGDLQCEPNATAGEITVTTNNVTPNRDFHIRIVASNSRDTAVIIDNGISKCFLCILHKILHLITRLFYVCSYI